MFENALVESSGKLRSKSRYWMLATFALNLAIVAMMVVIPLLHPEALPKTATIAMLTAPPPPPPPSSPTPTQLVKPVKPVAPLDAMVAPTKVPDRIDRNRETPPPALAATGVAGATMSGGASAVDGVIASLTNVTGPVIVAKQPEKPKQAGPLKVSSGVAAGSILTKTTPAYPAIAKAARISGVVVLHAIISKTGAIESLQVVSGPEMLRASALNAVRQWRYKPYLLNGEPTEVDTAVTVNFSFGG